MNAIDRCDDPSANTDHNDASPIGIRSWLLEAIFALICAEALFALPYRSVFLSGHSVLVSSIASLFVLAVVACLFALRSRLLPSLGRALRSPSISNRAWFIFWLVFGIILRLTWAQLFPVSLKSDHLAYFQEAALLAQGHTGVGAYWPPGFSLFLAPFFMVFGAHQWVTQLLALLFFVATYLLTYALADRIQGALVVRIAPMLIAIWPGYFTLAGINCKEVFLGALVPLALLLYLKASDFGSHGASSLDTGSRQMSDADSTRFRWSYFVAAGFCMGFATLTQPGYMLFPSVIFGTELLRGVGLLRSMGRTAVFSMALIAAVLPWTGRNFLVFHRVVLVSTNGGIVFYCANNPLANANYIPEGEVPLAKDQFEADRQGYKLGKEWIERHPGAFVALMVRKQVVFLGDDALGAYETLKRDLSPSVTLYASVKGISNLFWLALWSVILFGVPLLFSQKNWRGWYCLLFLPLLYQWAIDSVFESGPRHHVPYVALLAVLVGMVLDLAVQQSLKTDSLVSRQTSL